MKIVIGLVVILVVIAALFFAFAWVFDFNGIRTKK